MALHRCSILGLVAWLAVQAWATPAGESPAGQPALVVGITWAETKEVAIEQAETINRFETDLAIAVARTQGRQVSFRLGPLDLLLRELAEGRIDFMPGIARTKERQKQLDFSVPHSRLNTNLFVRRGDTRIVSAADLRGWKILVVGASFSHDWAVQRGYAGQLILVADLKEGVRRLATGEGDCLLAKQINLFAAMQSAGVNNIEARGPPIPELLQDMCIAVRGGNRDLLAQLNEGLFLLKQNGELDHIYEKWLGLLTPPDSFLIRNRRYLIVGAALLVLLASLAWIGYRVQLHRARVRLAEIEQRVAKRTEELAATKARYEAVVANTPAAILLIDLQDPSMLARLVDCNETTCRLHGYTKQELIGGSVNRLRVVPHTREILDTIIRELKSGHQRHGQCQHRRKDGSILEIEFYATLIQLEGRELLLGVNLDITDRVRTEAALRRTEEFQRLVLQASNDGIFDWDIASDHFVLSPHGWQLLGYTGKEFSGHRLDWWRCLHPDETPEAEALLKNHLANNVPFIHTARYLHKDGSIRWLYGRADTLRDAAGKPLRMVGSYTDITALKQIDDELQLTRRLRAIGELVGGIAHEFNNLLTPILLQTSLLVEKESGSPENITPLNAILDAARRAQTLTQQLLQLGREQDTKPTPHSLGKIIDGTLGLIRSTIDRRIEIRADYEPELPPVLLNTVTMGQLVMNLVLNARDALLEKIATAPPDWHPQLTLRLATYSGPERSPRRATRNPHPESWQRLSVIDNGTGIPPEIRERIFEPFFTTKAVGKGTGLGLAMVWHAVEDMGGWMEVESDSPLGTQFHIVLPATLRTVTTPPMLLTSAPSPSTPTSHRLLLVEDDDLVGSTINTMMRRLKQTVTWARSGEEALAHLQKTPSAFDVIFTDLNMPGLGGEALVTQVKQFGFRGKIIVLSGNITAEASQRLQAAGVTALVQKPFEFDYIRKLLSEL